MRPDQRVLLEFQLLLNLFSRLSPAQLSAGNVQFPELFDAGTIIATLLTHLNNLCLCQPRIGLQ